VIPYTIFDLKAKEKRNFDNVLEEIEIIEKQLKPLYKDLEYDLEDKYSDLFMQDDITFYNKKGLKDDV